MMKKKKKKTIKVLLAATIVFALTLAACNFEKEDPLEEGQKQLNAFFLLYEQDEELFSYDKENIQESTASFVAELPSEFFTKTFLEKSERVAKNTTFINPFTDSELFYLASTVEGTIKDSSYTATFNKYKIIDQSKAQFDKENKTVIFPIESEKSPYLFAVEMKKEDEKWKINSVTKP